MLKRVLTTDWLQRRTWYKDLSAEADVGLMHIVAMITALSRNPRQVHALLYHCLISSVTEGS